MSHSDHDDAELSSESRRSLRRLEDQSKNDRVRAMIRESESASSASSVSDSSDEEEPEEHDVDEIRGRFVPYSWNAGLINESSTGSHVWRQGSPSLYARLQRLLFLALSKALRLRRDSKWVATPNDEIDGPRIQPSPAAAIDDKIMTNRADSLAIDAIMTLAPEQHSDLASTLARIDDCGSEKSSNCDMEAAPDQPLDDEMSSDWSSSASDSESEHERVDPFPLITRLLMKLRCDIDDTFNNWKDHTLNIEDYKQWSIDRRNEIYTALQQVHPLITAPHDVRIFNVTKKVYGALRALGFPESQPSTGTHDTFVMRGVEVHGYSYHPRLFPTMTSINANFNPFALLSQLNQEQLDRRLGRPSAVPMPHTNQLINTAVILCEPKKKRNTIDDFRTLPHPKKAGLHAVEDVLVEEELQFRQCVQVNDHLSRHGSLKGLATHLYPLIFALIEYDMEEFAKLLSSRRVFLAGVPMSLMRRIIDSLKRKLAHFNASRDSVRVAVGTIGYYCQGVMWRDQVLHALTNSTKYAHYYLGMNELSTTQAPVLVANPWITEFVWLTNALKIILPDEPDTHQLYATIIPMLQGTWMDHIDSGIEQSIVGELWDSAWGPAGRTRTYPLTNSVTHIIQSLLSVTELLLSIKEYSTHDDASTFLTDFVDAGWWSDTKAATYMIRKERTRNLSSARICALAAAVEILRDRCSAVLLNDQAQCVRQLMETQHVGIAPWHVTQQVYRTFETIADDRTKAHLTRMIVSKDSNSDLVHPSLVLVGIPRVHPKDAAFRGT